MKRIEDILRKHGLEFSMIGSRRAAVPDACGRSVELDHARRLWKSPAASPILSTTGGLRMVASFNVLPAMIEFGPPNASIHKIDEHIAVADLNRLKRVSAHTRIAARIDAKKNNTIDAQANLRTLRDVLRYAVDALHESDLAFGHGQADAFEEAAFIVMRTLQLPLQRSTFLRLRT